MKEDTGNTTTKWIIAVAVVVVVAGVLYFLFGQAKPFETARESGRIEINRGEEYKYFTYVSADTALGLLNDARASGDPVYLFPQIDFGDFEKLVIRERDVATSRGGNLTILSIGGLPPDAVVRSNINGTVRASVLNYESADAVSLVIFTGNDNGQTSEFYLPYVPGENDIAEEFQGIVDVAFGTPLIDIAGETYLENEIFPENSQLALVIKSIESAGVGGGRAGGLDNVLTRLGKIVMVE